MNLTLSIAQMDVSAAQPEMNLMKAEAWIAEAARRGSALVCFPEMWTTGFNWKENTRIAGDHEKIESRIAGLARQHSIWIAGSVLKRDGSGKLSNAAVLLSPNGQQAGVYRKIHLFSMFHEEKHLTAGDRLTVVDAPWGLTGFAICYDLRFPELFRSYALKNVQLIILPAAFPLTRLEHWKVLMRARAIENQLFIVGINQVGSEDLGEYGVIAYGGSSAVIDPWGNAVVEAGRSDEILLTATIRTDQTQQARSAMHVLGDRRPELYDLGPETAVR